jgi:hypothetical protein
MSLKWFVPYRTLQKWGTPIFASLVCNEQKNEIFPLNTEARILPGPVRGQFKLHSALFMAGKTIPVPVPIFSKEVAFLQFVK